ncbi:uncharacterized protein [Arachis hypogaea]|uniref:uncharacterized protein n=1 Tax=Arachis hypogaea TaxID=3818 RepID=UPI003B2175D0
MNIIAWNCRGAGGKGFSTLIRDLRKDLDVNFVILLETHISGVRGERVRNRLGLNGKFVVDARGQSGGIWCMWDSNLWRVEILSHTFQFVHMKVEDKNANQGLLTAVYGSPNRAFRKSLWDDLRKLSRDVRMPWCAIGDFNVILYDHEWSRGAMLRQGGECPEFNACLSDCEASIQHLPNLKSDHSPLLLNLAPQASPNKGRRPFIFLAAWLDHPGFDDVVNSGWDLQGNWNSCMENFQKVLKNWNHNVFGNIHQKKSKILRRLQGIKNSLNMNPNLYLEKLQRELWEEYEEILAQEELLWFQKSRCNWLKFGDRNTKFFHASTMARRRRNRIEALQDDNGNWIHEQTTLERMATSFYSRLYIEDTPDTPFVLNNCFPPLDTIDLESIGSNVSRMEIRSALFSMGSLKAPGKDGIQAIFYQKKWDVVGTNLCVLVERIFNRPSEVWEINETLITLIPKVEPIVTLKQMCPISLCNVSYKVITKILSRRLRGIMEKVVKPTQSIFVLGRHTSDNIIITQEVINCMRNRKGKKGWMAIKIDLEKAYDRLK